MSKEDFVAEADAICTSHDEEFANELQPTFPNVDPTSSTATDDDLRAFEQPLSATHELRTDQVDELRALTPPKDFEDEWETILGHLDTSVEAFANASEAAGNADREGIAAAFQEADEAGAAADEVAEGLWLRGVWPDVARSR